MLLFFDLSFEIKAVLVICRIHWNVFPTTSSTSTIKTHVEKRNQLKLIYKFKIQKNILKTRVSRVNITGFDFENVEADSTIRRTTVLAHRLQLAHE